MLNKDSQAETKVDSSTTDDTTTSSPNAAKPNVISRFFREWITKRRTRKFEREFDKYYTGLLLGDLYDAKVRLLSKMKKEKQIWLKKYLEFGYSVSRQIDEVLSNGL